MLITQGEMPREGAPPQSTNNWERERERERWHEGRGDSRVGAYSGVFVRAKCR